MNQQSRKLILATKAKDYDHVLAFVSKQGANICVHRGLPLITFAISCKDIYLAKMLLDRGADPNALDARGFSPLWYALSADDEESTVLLLQSGSELSKCCRSNDLLTTLLEKCSDQLITAVSNIVQRDPRTTAFQDSDDSHYDNGSPN